MAVDFLTNEQKAQYGQFPDEIEEAQLSRYFHLDEADIAFISTRRGDQNKLGVALQMTSVRFLGMFLSNLTQAPESVTAFLAAQLSITNEDSLKNYSLRETTKREHTALIRKRYAYREFNDPPWSFRLSRLLYSRAWVSNERPSLLFNVAVDWLIQNKVLLPGITTLSRLVSEIRERTANRLWRQLSSLPSKEQKSQLETILKVSDEYHTSDFDRYRKGPVSISSKSFNTAVKRYRSLRDFGLRELNLSSIPPIRLKSMARHAGTISMHKIARMPDEKRIAMLVAFVSTFEVSALDDAIDVLDLLITDITGEAKRLGLKKRLRTLKDMDKSALALAQVCALILDESSNIDQLRDAIFSRFPKKKLIESISTVNKLARPPSGRFNEEIVEQYGKIKRCLPSLFYDIDFGAAPAGNITLEVLRYLADEGVSRKQILEDPPLEIITKPWKRLVFDEQGRVNKRSYILCALERLQDSLRRRDVFVVYSERWGDPRKKLLQDDEWKSNRINVCRSLGHPVLPQKAISQLEKDLNDAYEQVSANFDENDSISIDNSGQRPTITIANLDKLEEPDSLTQLSNQVTDLLPKVDLTELLLEIHTHTGFLDEFSHVSESKARMKDLPISLCAGLMAEACNIGMEPLIKHHVPALTRHRLSSIKQNYVRAETLTKANVRLVNYQSTLPLAQKWGGGHVASADGMRFITPVQTINARPNKKYFRNSKGITWYNFLSDQYSGFHGIVIPGTLRDSIFVLEGLLEQQTGLRPTEIMTDTTGTSDIVFGLFWLLGYQFSPRLADAGEAVFWRIDKEADYGSLNDIARGQIHIHRIEQYWDDMLRIAGSLKLGTVRASELVRSLLKSDRPSSLAQAIIELGRINKTLYLLNYIDDEDYRRRILTQLNRTEGRHSVARIICHGQLGEIRKRYTEGQEDQLGALGLVTNAVVLWNTIYMQAALDHIRESTDIREEDEARLSPLAYGHLNVLGHYSFTLADQVKNGQLRPLNQPNDDEIIIP